MPATLLAVVLAVADYGVPSPKPHDSITFGLIGGAVFIALGLVIVGLTTLSARRTERDD
jgi:hypothetical protein